MADTHLDGMIVSGVLVPKPNAVQRLLCFPWAGGGKSLFVRWDAQFPPDIKVLAVLLPGRENRLEEKHYDEMCDAANDIAHVIHKNYADKPLSMYGHSLGAKLAFETALALKSKYNIDIQHFFVSGCYAPHSMDGLKSLHVILPEDLTDQFLLGYITEQGGTPSRILNNKELLAVLFPPLRADLKMLRKYRYPGVLPAVTCPVHAFDGETDVDHYLQEWPEITDSPSSLRTFKGGHFFMTNKETSLELRDFFCSVLSTG